MRGKYGQFHEAGAGLKDNVEKAQAEVASIGGRREWAAAWWKVTMSGRPMKVKKVQIELRWRVMIANYWRISSRRR